MKTSKNVKNQPKKEIEKNITNISKVGKKIINKNKALNFVS